jgi:hypothetical protein
VNVLFQSLCCLKKKCLILVFENPGVTASTRGLRGGSLGLRHGDSAKIFQKMKRFFEGSS